MINDPRSNWKVIDVYDNKIDGSKTLLRIIKICMLILWSIMIYGVYIGNISNVVCIIISIIVLSILLLPMSMYVLVTIVILPLYLIHYVLYTKIRNKPNK